MVVFVYFRPKKTRLTNLTHSSEKNNERYYIFTFINSARVSTVFVQPDKLQINTKYLILAADRCITPFGVKL
jgi:hypothetical protein